MAALDATVAREFASEESCCFVPTRLAEHAEPALDALERWALDAEGPLFGAVMGEYGIGKATTLKQLTHRLLDRKRQEASTPLPIFVDLRAYSETIRQGRVPKLRELLAEVFARPWKDPNPVDIQPDEVLRLVREEGALLIFDGLDEKLVHLGEPDARAFVRELWSALPPQAFRSGQENLDEPKRGRVGKLVFSCRSHYFKTLRDQGALLRGEGRDGVRAADYRAWILLPFDEHQIEEYLVQVLGNQVRANAALDLLASVHDLRELSHRPYLLSLIVPQIKHLEAKRARGERVFGVTLYEMLVEECLNRDDGKHTIHKEDKRRLMEDLAGAMWHAGVREWPWSEARQWLGQRIGGDPVLSARYWRSSHQAGILDEDFRTATLVLRPDTSLDGFRFAHTSLHEFFLACHLGRALVERRLEAWALPLPSLEALEFLGQLLLVEPRSEQRAAACATLRTLLASYQPQATEAAFRYWLLAVERGLPEPAPGAVDLRGADLAGWFIAGSGADKPLCLRNATLSRTELANTRWRWVNLSGASLRQARLFGAELCQVVATELEVCHADLTGSTWRECEIRKLVGGAEATWHGASWVGSIIDVQGLGSGYPLQGSLSRCRTDDTAEMVTAPLPDRGDAVHHLSWGHGSAVLACAWSPDGTRIVSGSYDNTLKLWEPHTGRELMTLALGPGGETAAVDLANQRVLCASREAWCFLVWRWFDPVTGACRLLPGDHFEALPAETVGRPELGP